MNADPWFDYMEKEDLPHNPENCVRCSELWWMGIGWKSAWARQAGWVE